MFILMRSTGKEIILFGEMFNVIVNADVGNGPWYMSRIS